jgi:hypothetical protein
MDQVADQLYRCKICGKPIPNPIKLSRTGGWVIMRLSCLTHGISEKRLINKKLFPRIQELHLKTTPDALAHSLPPRRFWTMLIAGIGMTVGGLIYLPYTMAVLNTSPEDSMYGVAIFFGVMLVGILVAGVAFLLFWIINYLTNKGTLLSE